MSCVVADNSISALKIPLLDYLLLHKDPPSYLSDPPHRKDNRQYKTCTPSTPTSRTIQIQGQIFPPQRQQLKERQNNAFYSWGLTAEVTFCLDQFPKPTVRTQVNLFTSWELFSAHNVQLW